MIDGMEVRRQQHYFSLDCFMYRIYTAGSDVWLKLNDDPDGNSDNDNDDGHTGSGAVQTEDDDEPKGSGTVQTEDDDEPKGSGTVQTEDDDESKGSDVVQVRDDREERIRLRLVGKITFPLSHPLPTQKRPKVGK